MNDGANRLFLKIFYAMPFVKDTSYREMPYSSETPSNDFHSFLSLKQVVAKVTKHQNHFYNCRTIGTVTSEFGFFALHEIDDTSYKIRLSLAHMKRPIKYSGLPFTAQLFGFVHWRGEHGPVMYAQILQVMPPFLAVSLRATMKWAADTHLALHSEMHKEE